MSDNKAEVPRVTGLLVIEVRNSNPNGDPDRESDPRTRAHDGKGVISDVSFKRKLRELVLQKNGPVWKDLKILLMLDVPVSRYEEIRAIIARTHPEAADRGNEPTVPAFP